MPLYCTNKKLQWYTGEISSVAASGEGIDSFFTDMSQLNMAGSRFLLSCRAMSWSSKNFKQLSIWCDFWASTIGSWRSVASGCSKIDLETCIWGACKSDEKCLFEQAVSISPKTFFGSIREAYTHNLFLYCTGWIWSYVLGFACTTWEVSGLCAFHTEGLSADFSLWISAPSMFETDLLLLILLLLNCCDKRDIMWISATYVSSIFVYWD